MIDPLTDLDDFPMLSLQPVIERFLAISMVAALLFFLVTCPMGLFTACVVCLSLQHVPALGPYHIPLPHDAWPLEERYQPGDIWIFEEGFQACDVWEPATQPLLLPA